MTQRVTSARLRDLVIVAGLPLMFAGVACCWLLARPTGPEVTALPGAVTVGAGVLLLGLGGLPLVGAEPSARLIGAVAGVWTVGALVAAWVRTAQQVGVGVTDVGVGQFSEVMSHGAPELVATVCGLLAVAWAVAELLDRSVAGEAAAAVLAAIGLVAVAIAGHAAQHPIGPVLVAGHALAAAWWCGTLAALVLTVRGRSGWATSLPQFSQRAPWAVGVLAATGVLAAVVEMGSPAELVGSGYGRIILAKVAVLAVLLVAASRHRRTWVPAVARHNVAEDVTIRRAVVHTLVMAVVLGLAVGLAATAP